MKFTILGSCSGTEAMPGRRHTSICLETGGRNYLFDAGDSCGYAAQMLGIDIQNIRQVFISHPHIDHIGGLPYLFFSIQKLYGRQGRPFERPIDLFCSAPEIMGGVRLMLSYNGSKPFDHICARHVDDGLLSDDGVLRVTAMHNGHMGETEPPYHAFSYLLEAEGKRVVYSGDVKSVAELYPWLDCDLMFMETGHHDPAEVAAYLAACGRKPAKLVFYHHGRKILADPAGCFAEAKSVFANTLAVAEDGMVIEL